MMKKKEKMNEEKKLIEKRRMLIKENEELIDWFWRLLVLIGILLFYSIMITSFLISMDDEYNEYKIQTQLYKLCIQEGYDDYYQDEFQDYCIKNGKYVQILTDKTYWENITLIGLVDYLDKGEVKRWKAYSKK